jgi:hypothetical protein
MTLPADAAAAVLVAPAAAATAAVPKTGAHDADRTRDLSLTKGVLYH